MGILPTACAAITWKQRARRVRQRAYLPEVGCADCFGALRSRARALEAPVEGIEV